MGLTYEYRGGGSGRSYSCTDMVLLDVSIPQYGQGQGNRMDLSRRVFGNGEIKGPWQWSVQAGEQLLDALQDSNRVQKQVHVVQQLWGDMVLDETMFGFISNYNQTVFFRRHQDVCNKGLQFSPVINAEDEPLKAFLFMLVGAHKLSSMKPLLSRDRVPVTPIGGHTLRLPLRVYTTRSGRRSSLQVQPPLIVKVVGSKRQRQVLDLHMLDISPIESISALPVYDMKQLGLTSRVIGLGKYGNVLEATFPGNLAVAIKTFDLRSEQALHAFFKEREAYTRLRSVQGVHVPSLYAVGRMPHCNMPFLGLSDEGDTKLSGSTATRAQKRATLVALNAIHQCGVLHNDLATGNILLSDGIPKFIDFDKALFNPSHEELCKEAVQLRNFWKS